jgi:hypothetical protein
MVEMLTGWTEGGLQILTFSCWTSFQCNEADFDLRQDRSFPRQSVLKHFREVVARHEPACPASFASRKGRHEFRPVPEIQLLDGRQSLGSGGTTIFDATR